MRKVLIALAGLTLAACGALPPTTATGENVSTQHPQARFSDAVDGANTYCGSRSKAAKHLGTDRIGPFQAVSRFECVPK